MFEIYNLATGRPVYSPFKHLDIARNWCSALNVKWGNGYGVRPVIGEQT